MNALRTALAWMLARAASGLTWAAGAATRMEQRVRPYEGGPRPVVPK